MWKFLKKWACENLGLIEPAGAADEVGVYLLVATPIGLPIPWEPSDNDPVCQADSYGYRSNVLDITRSFCCRPRHAHTPAIQLVSYGKRPVFDVQIMPLKVNYPDRTVPAECIFKCVPVLYPNVAAAPMFNPIAFKLYLDGVASGGVSAEITVKYRDFDAVMRTVVKIQASRSPYGVKVLSQETFHD